MYDKCPTFGDFIGTNSLTDAILDSRQLNDIGYFSYLGSVIHVGIVQSRVLAMYFYNLILQF